MILLRVMILSLFMGIQLVVAAVPFAFSTNVDTTKTEVTLTKQEQRQLRRQQILERRQQHKALQQNRKPSRLWKTIFIAIAVAYILYNLIGVVLILRLFIFIW